MIRVLLTKMFTFTSLLLLLFTMIHRNKCARKVTVKCKSSKFAAFYALQWGMCNYADPFTSLALQEWFLSELAKLTTSFEFWPRDSQNKVFLHFLFISVLFLNWILRPVFLQKSPIDLFLCITKKNRVFSKKLWYPLRGQS